MLTISKLRKQDLYVDLPVGWSVQSEFLVSMYIKSDEIAIHVIICMSGSEMHERASIFVRNILEMLKMEEENILRFT